MAKKKDYLKMFVDHCEVNGIWFSVCTNRTIDSVSFTNDGIDTEPDTGIIIGSKEAYDWLIKEGNSHHQCPNCNHIFKEEDNG
jgi:hypothetical protein